MNEIDRLTLRAQVPIFLSQLGLCAAMVGVFAILGRLTDKVIFGAILGAAASLLNYLVMIFSLLRAEKSESPEKAQKPNNCHQFLSGGTGAFGHQF